MMTSKLLSTGVLLGLFTGFLPRTSDGFNDNAHDRLSRRAVDPTLPNASQLDNFLKTILGFEFCPDETNCQGVNQPISGGDTVVDLIADGSVKEDRPASRVLHHYHDPTQTWNSAGFKLGPFSPYLSSIVWSQLTTPQPYGETRTWKTARDAYFNALTGTTPSERKQWYAETFRTLGHLIHHIQDAAVPAHTRNDNHFAPFEKSIFPLGDRFHHWADKNLGVIDESISAQQGGILRFVPSLLQQTSPNSLAPVPISRIIDKTDNDSGALSTDLNIGLAEYSNANFFSEHTVLSTAYQYPRLSQLQVGPPETLPGLRRRYLRFQPGFGHGPTYRVSTYSTVLPYIASALPLERVDVGLDDNVFKDYGLKLFPRAIGYSAGLIDYFFRGQIQPADPPLGYILVPWEMRPSSINVEGVKIIGEAQQTGSGTMRMVLLHRNSFLGIQDPPSSPGPKPVVVVSNEVPFTISAQAQTVTFPFAELPWPTTAPPALCCYGNGYMGIIVYRGTLGQEMNNAVVASGYCRDAPSGETWERFYSFERTPTQAYIGMC